MTEIDTSADLDIVWRQDEVAVNIPLAGEVPAGWARRYDELARRQGLAAQAQEASQPGLDRRDDAGRDRALGDGGGAGFGHGT